MWFVEHAKVPYSLIFARAVTHTRTRAWCVAGAGAESKSETQAGTDNDVHMGTQGDDAEERVLDVHGIIRYTQCCYPISQPVSTNAPHAELCVCFVFVAS